MQLRRFFINDVGRLRSGWRLLLFVCVFIAVSFLLGLCLRTAYVLVHQFLPPVPHGAFIADVIYRLTLLCTAVVAGYFCTRVLEGLPWRALGLTFHSGWFRDLLLGSVLGIATLALAAMIATAAGGLRFTMSGTGMLLLVGRSLVSTAVLFIVAALAEEAMFRGYPLQTLTRARLIWLGVLLTSVPFALAHLWNPNVVRGVTFANTALAGVWLAIAYLRTRSLWFPLGVHWAWNWALGSLCGLPVSGVTLTSHPLLQGKDLGPAWLTGGSYGIEGGAACTAALLVSTLFIWRTHLAFATPEMKKLTSEENPAIPAAVVSIHRTS
jgi:membrane protease YdiL (CAAX protease family)